MKEYSIITYDLTAMSYPELPYRDFNINCITFYIGVYLYNKQGELLVVDDPSESDHIQDCYWYKDGNIKQAEYRSNIYYDVLQTLNGQVSQTEGIKLINQDNLYFKLREFKQIDHAVIKITDVDLYYKMREVDSIPILDFVPFKLSVDDACKLICDNFANFNNSDNLPIINKFGGYKFWWL